MWEQRGQEARCSVGGDAVGPRTGSAELQGDRVHMVVTKKPRPRDSTTLDTLREVTRVSVGSPGTFESSGNEEAPR